MALVVDTGPLVAALLRAEPRHRECARLLSEATEPRVIPAPVLPEVDWICRREGESLAFRSLLRDIEAERLALEDLIASDYARVSELLEAYEDLRLGFVDAAVLAIVERLGESKLATLDRRHFSTLRPRHVEALELVPS